MGEVEVGEEGGLEDGHLLDPGPGHVERADRLGLVEDVLDGLRGQRVEGEIDLLDVDEDVGVGGDVTDVVVRHPQRVEVEVLQCKK